MKHHIATLVLGAAALIAPALAQQNPSPTPSPLLIPAPLEKELAAKAANVTEVTLGKNMIGFAAKFMDSKDKDQAAARQLIEGLDGIYVRDYEFDKEGEYSMDDVARLREAFQSPEWTPIVHTRESKGAETTDVLVKQVNGEPHGMFVLSAEPKELTIVLILGPIRLDQLGQLSGLSGLGALGDVDQSMKKKEKAEEKAQQKAQELQKAQDKNQ